MMYDDGSKTTKISMASDTTSHQILSRISRRSLPSGFEKLDMQYANLRKSMKRYAWKHSSYKKH